MKRITKIVAIALMIAIMGTTMVGCSESEKVSWNVSKEADNFNVVRRLTVINIRSDKPLLQMTGTFSIKNDSDGDLNVICELPNGTYQKHFVHLNQWVTYVVEDISNTEVSKYAYELEFMPQSLVNVKITANELLEDIKGKDSKN